MKTIFAVCLAFSFSTVFAGCEGTLSGAPGDAKVDSRVDARVDASLDGSSSVDADRPRDSMADAAQDALVCTPNCIGRGCGIDGCGGVCGNCNNDQTCNANGQCEGGQCTPNCNGRMCGDNGCSGTCGSCNNNQMCTGAGQCENIVCTPNCNNRSCGDNGCGGTCGNCNNGQSCNGNGQCETPAQDCPLSRQRTSFPENWAEGQCIYTWDRSDQPWEIARAHYVQGQLSARMHKMDGSSYFIGSGTLSNLGMPFEQAMRFCLTEPVNGQCTRSQEPDCSGLRNIPNCMVVFGWQCGGCSGQGEQIRVRVANNGVRWVEKQDRNSGQWFRVGGGWGGMGPWENVIGGPKPENFDRCFLGEPDSTPACN